MSLPKIGTSFETSSRASFIKVSALIAHAIRPSLKERAIITIQGNNNIGKSLVVDAMVNTWRDDVSVYRDTTESGKMSFEDSPAEAVCKLVGGEIISEGEKIDVFFVRQDYKLPPSPDLTGKKQVIFYVIGSVSLPDTSLKIVLDKQRDSLKNRWLRHWDILFMPKGTLINDTTMELVAFLANVNDRQYNRKNFQKPVPY